MWHNNGIYRSAAGNWLKQTMRKPCIFREDQGMPEVGSGGNESAFPRVHRLNFMALAPAPENDGYEQISDFAE